MDSSHHDITERRRTGYALRESGSRYRILLESLPQLVWTSRPDGACCYVSRQWVEYTGVKADQLWGLGWIDVLHPDDRQRVQDHWRQGIQTENAYEIESRIRRVDGIYRRFTTWVVPIRDTAGQLVEWLGSSTDVEDQLQAFNAELEQRVRNRVADLTRAQEVLEMRNLDLQQFAYMASHDLKTPLRTISGFLELLGTTYGGQLGVKGADWIRRASDGARRLEALIDNLLAYSRVDSQAQPFELVELGEVVADCLEDLGAEIQASGAEIIAGTLPTVAGDRTQLTQLFQNLLGNAIKYRSAKRPLIRVSAQWKKNEWIFAVADNGVGIEPEHHEKIFELFRRLRTHKSLIGDGIGLSVCRRIVTRHGGKIWVESQPGQGCTVLFTLVPSSIHPINSHANDE
ncbi:MAG: PAS domain-containing protein [Verrucomicrobia bacterium]|nr:PAS domain-containing protein [Verrucomicrobiota bacterium]